MVAIGAVTGATSNTRQVGGFTAQLPPQEPQEPQATQPPLPPGHRHIPLRPGAPLLSRLEPDDKILEVFHARTPSMFAVKDIPAEQELDLLLKAENTVAIIEVTNKEGFFSATYLNGPDDWITSILTVQVHEVLKDTTGQLVAGNLMNVREHGGEITLPDGRRIIAHPGWGRLTRVGGTYLAVLGFYEGEFGFDKHLSVEFDNGTIKRMRKDAPPDTDLEQKTPEWATQRARVAAERAPH
jgi:hypothetical protein